LVVDDDQQARGVVEGELRKRYGADYEVVGVGSADASLVLLAKLRDDQRRVSIVLAGESVSQLTGTQLLARVREFHSTAKRLLLIHWQFGPPPEPILQAIALGHIDAYSGRPATVPDEVFHLTVTELLGKWARSNLPGPEVMRVVGEEWSARSHEIRDLLSRNVVPFGFYPEDVRPGRALLEQVGATAATLPVIIMFDGRVLENPSNTQIAEAIGVQTSPGADLYDVAVIGAGPAGLAAALAARAYTQAWNFGAEYVYGNPATGLRAQGRERVVTIAGGDEVRSRAVIIATGVSYRRLGIPSLDGLTGVGVFYGAASSEAEAMKDREVFVVGGANSAGQAAVHLARYAARVTMLVRGQSLAESMSEYLIKEITSTPNIGVRHNAVVTGGTGTRSLESLTIQDPASGVTETVPAAALFVLIGAEPHTQWLPDDVKRDWWGFVVTGTDLMAGGHPPGSWPLQRPPMFLESSLPGVFAAGDVRCGSVKRVASAVGEGSVAIRLIHDYLRDDPGV
jgi:thioredoxin reductase (NADPH)